MTRYTVVNCETAETSTHTSFAVAVRKARSIGHWASILERTATRRMVTHREFNEEGREISCTFSETK